MLVPRDPCCPWPASRCCSPHVHPAPSERLVALAFTRRHVCHRSHLATASRRRGPPHFRCEANRENRLRFAWNPPAIRPMASPQAGGDQTTCSPSTGHGLRHSTWEGFRTMHLYQQLSLGGGRIGGGSFLFIKAQPVGRLSLPGPSAVLVKQLKTGSCHAE